MKFLHWVKTLTTVKSIRLEHLYADYELIPENISETLYLQIYGHSGNLILKIKLSSKLHTYLNYTVVRDYDPSLDLLSIDFTNYFIILHHFVERSGDHQSILYVYSMTLRDNNVTLYFTSPRLSDVTGNYYLDCRYIKIYKVQVKYVEYGFTFPTFFGEGTTNIRNR
ncbi:MAG: hypothetical protein IH840_08350 [Candidatus Heimdallarchaeota archaeon]|nr:hypothetical protein [Candidatus Heimdallarchaeota archaeon]